MVKIVVISYYCSVYYISRDSQRIGGTSIGLGFRQKKRIFRDALLVRNAPSFQIADNRCVFVGLRTGFTQDAPPRV